METADLRAAKDDMSSLQAEHDHLATVRLMKQVSPPPTAHPSLASTSPQPLLILSQVRCEAIQQELREIALSRVAPPAISEQRYLSSQLLAIEEARKAEGKYQGVLTGTSSEQSIHILQFTPVFGPI